MSMEPRDRNVKRQSSGFGVAAAVLFGVLTIAFFGLAVSGFVTDSEPSVQERSPTELQELQSDRSAVTPQAEQPGIPPAEVKPPDSVAGKTSPDSKQPADAVDPGNQPPPVTPITPEQ